MPKETVSYKQVTIYTDGACRGNPGPGGYGIVMLHNGHRRELSKGFRETTNNRMELLAAIVGLETLKYACKVTLYTDSQYLSNAINKGWIFGWRKKGWNRGKQGELANADLWRKLYTLIGWHKVEFVWVRGHASNKENNRCDQLAVTAATGNDLDIDKGYMQSS